MKNIGGDVLIIARHQIASAFVDHDETGRVRRADALVCIIDARGGVDVEVIATNQNRTVGAVGSKSNWKTFLSVLARLATPGYPAPPGTGVSSEEALPPVPLLGGARGGFIASNAYNTPFPPAKNTSDRPFTSPNDGDDQVQ